LKINELIEYAQKIIGGRLQLDYFSRLYGTVIFRQDIDKISDAEIENIVRALIANGIYTQLQVTRNEYLLRIFVEYSKIKREKWIINVLLFLLTTLTTAMIGAELRGVSPFENIRNIYVGLPYSFAVLMILTAHEFGHYYHAVKNKIYATLPYFIPFYFPFLFSLGTFGAFIKIKSPIPNKRALLDVGIAGPLAGLAVSFFFLIYGFAELPDREGVIRYVSQIHEWSEDGSGALTMGSSLLFYIIRHVMGGAHLPMYEIYHFPFIFAGWIGLLVTALNLMPVGQLDGGHITYALLGRKAKTVGTVVIIALILLIFYSLNYIVWILLIFFVIRRDHPPTMNDSIGLDNRRRILAWISYLILILCFSPKPIYIS
jgi:membrane-associated protease RseP (regulator of RpoE activity)